MPPFDSMICSGAAKPASRTPALTRRQVASRQRLDVGVDDGRRAALEFLDLRQHLGRQRHRHFGQVLARAARAAARSFSGLVKACRKQIATDLTPSSRRRAAIAAISCGSTARSTLPSARMRSSTRQPQRARHQRLRRIGEQFVGRDPHVAAQFEYVAESGGAQQRGAGALALDDGVGDQRRRMRQPRRRARIARRLCAQTRRSRRAALPTGRPAWLVAYRRGPRRSLVEQHEIGKGAADVATRPVPCHPPFPLRAVRVTLVRSIGPECTLTNSIAGCPDYI